jgi:tRNA pseudouridine55 synthase
MRDGGLGDGSMMNGILPLRKPPGCTSHDLVVWARRLLGVKKIGHAGTLDPAVSGVLPLCIGKATRLIEYLHQLPKAYVGEMILGKSTDTLDGDGQVLEEVPVAQVDRDRIEQAFQRFTGEIEQEPPLYSAIKVEGKKLYQYAREKIPVEVPKRKVHVHELRLLHLSRQGKEVSIQFKVTCSTGTYIRSLCRDIGLWLGYPAYMSRLVRIQSGPFALEDCVEQKEVEAAATAGTVDQLLRPLDAALPHLPALDLEHSLAARLSRGQAVRLEAFALPTEQYPEDTYRVYGLSQGKRHFVATAKLRREEQFVLITPEKVFLPV